ELRSDDAGARTVAPHANHVAALCFGEAMRQFPMRHGPLALAGAVNPRMPHTGSPGARIESPAGMMVRHRPGVGRRIGDLAGFGRAGEEVRVSDGVCLAPGHGLCLDQWLFRGGVQQAFEYLDGGLALLE